MNTVLLIYEIRLNDRKVLWIGAENYEKAMQKIQNKFDKYQGENGHQLTLKQDVDGVYYIADEEGDAYQTNDGVEGWFLTQLDVI